MSSCYLQEMLQQPGAEDLKKTMLQWDVLSSNLGKATPGLPIVLPDYLFLAKYGSGISTYLQIMTNYLDEVGLMHFCGDKKYIEFYLSYCDKGTPFEDLSRLSDVINAAAGFHDKFSGVLMLDCTEWMHSFDSHHMKTLLHYLMDHSRDWLIFIVVNCDDPALINHIEAVISSYLRINVLHLDYPEIPNMLSYMENRLNDYGFTIDEGGKALLEETITSLSKKEYFYGFRTLDYLIEEIIYTIYSSNTSLTKELNSEMLQPFAVNGSYIDYLIDHMKKQSMGFV